MARSTGPLARGLPVRRVERADDAALGPGQWPRTVPAVDQLLREGLDLGPVTVLVGENGSGKSTIVEAVAAAYGLGPEGGSPNARHTTRPTESPLSADLRLSRGATGTRWGFFLRAETMHGLYTYLESVGEVGLHELSHGESFLEVLRERFTSSGFYVLDEPESALSFGACLGLVGLLHELVTTRGAQVLVATHSPVVAAVPGATILELDASGYRQVAWDELDLVAHYRRFLEAPGRYLRHVVDG